MTAMVSRVLASVAMVAGLALADLATAGPPARYLPAPPGKVYYLLYGSGSALGTYTSSDAGIPSTPDGLPHDFASEWTATTAEVGLTLGYGLGSLWAIRSLDLSAYVPFYVRDYTLKSYYRDGSSDNVAYAWANLHPNIRAGEPGKGVGDPTVSLLSLWYENRGTGTWLGQTMRLSLPVAASAHERFVRILHGDAVPAGGGEGVARFTPAVSAIKTIGGQRTYVSAEYSIPLGAESFAFTAPDREFAPGVPYDDANKPFTEEITPGGIVFATLGIETSLNLLGVTPGLEFNLRSYQPATWKENGADGAAGTPVTSFYPVQTPEFLTTGAWAVGGLPLKANTEIEVLLQGTVRFQPADLLRLGVSYISGGFGHSIGFRVAFVSLFLEKPVSDRAIPGKAEAREVDVAPVLEAPAAPASRVLTGVTYPVFGAGISQEEAGWVAGQIRAAVARLKGYDLFPEKAMEQLAFTPCGDSRCGTQYGRALRLPAMVVSKIDRNASGYALSVGMIDVAAGTVAASKGVVAASLDDMKPLIPGLLQQLVTPAAAPAATR